MFTPDFQIAAMCSDDFPRVWSPSGGPDVGRELPIQNPGPLISPFDAKYLGPASYDIQIGLKFASPSPIVGHILHDRERVASTSGFTEIDGERLIKQYRGNGIEVILEPHQAVLCHSVEYIRVPPHFVGLLSMRSSFARDWIDHSAADCIWPGFQGNITFELRNNGPHPYSLRSGDRALQLAFARMAAVPAHPYNGVYQNQNAQLHRLDAVEVVSNAA